MSIRHLRVNGNYYGKCPAGTVAVVVGRLGGGGRGEEREGERVTGKGGRCDKRGGGEPGKGGGERLPGVCVWGGGGTRQQFI